MVHEGKLFQNKKNHDLNILQTQKIVHWEIVPN
jgi:hypothetical protein